MTENQVKILEEIKKVQAERRANNVPFMNGKLSDWRSKVPEMETEHLIRLRHLKQQFTQSHQ